MFELLTRILLWSLIFGIIWYVFVQFIPRLYLTWLGGLLIAVFIVLAFFDPTDRTVNVVWNLLSLPLRPLGLTILLLLVALRNGTAKIAGNSVLAALLVLLISSTPIVSYWLTSQTEQAVLENIQAQGDRPADPALVRAIVVLGDTVDPTYNARIQVNSAQAGFGTALTSRLLYATQLYREQSDQGNSPLVIVSPGPQRDPEDVTQNQAITNFLTGRGVPADRVAITTTGATVRSSAVEVEQLLRDRGFTQNNSVILVTSAINIRRAASTFSQVGLDPVSRPTDLLGFQIQPEERFLMLEDLVPSVDALALTSRVIEEYLASIYYFLRGWLVNPEGF
jgi:uncharacterized SAM-binding protein YcdF (DUF218 family)